MYVTTWNHKIYVKTLEESVGKPRHNVPGNRSTCSHLRGFAIKKNKMRTSKPNINPNRDWALRFHRKQAESVTAQLQYHSGNEVVRNNADAYNIILKVLRADYVDYVPIYACIYVNRLMQPLHTSIECMYNHTLTNVGLANIINRAVAIGAFGIILATNIISHNGKKEQDMLFRIGMEAIPLLEQHNLELVDCFTFNSQKYVELLFPAGLSYFNVEGSGYPSN